MRDLRRSALWLKAQSAQTEISETQGASGATPVRGPEQKKGQRKAQAGAWAYLKAED